MLKPTLSLLVLAFVALGFQQQQSRKFYPLKEEVIRIEYTVSEDEAVVVVEAESENELSRLEVRGPGGEAILSMQARNGQAFSGFTVEMQEDTYAALLENYAEGEYDVRARTMEGDYALGTAELSLDLPAAPVVIYPYDGATNVPITNLTIAWIADPEVEAYVVNMEQDENDGLTIELPPGTNKLHIPHAVLAPGVETQLEIGAIGPNGNITLIESYFTTAE